MAKISTFLRIRGQYHAIPPIQVFQTGNFRPTSFCKNLRDIGALLPSDLNQHASILRQILRSLLCDDAISAQTIAFIG